MTEDKHAEIRAAIAMRNKARDEMQRRVADRYPRYYKRKNFHEVLSRWFPMFRLERSIPPLSRASIVHNDLKLDNCQFASPDPDRVVSIFDWDMTTLGDPLIDLGTLLNYWPDPADPESAQRASNPGLAKMGLPSRAEITARYAAQTGANLPAVRWWEAFALWKTAVVVQQLHRRWVRGESTDPRMARIADRMPSLIAAAVAVLDEAGI